MCVNYLWENGIYEAVRLDLYYPILILFMRFQISL